MDETQRLLSAQVSAYYTDLTDRGVPSELAADLVRDWHACQLIDPLIGLAFNVTGATSYEIASIVNAARGRPLHVAPWVPPEADQGAGG